MAVITENTLRAMYKAKPFTTFLVAEGQLMTPSAIQFLNERRIVVERQAVADTDEAPQQSEGNKEGAERSCSTDQAKKTRSYVSAADGGAFTAKPEDMTQLKGNRLVAKNHPRIRFRGKLDSLHGAVTKTQALAHREGRKPLVAALGELLEQIRMVIRGEVLDSPVEDSLVIGLSPDKLRQISHNPKKFFGIGHLLPDYTMAELTLELDLLRSQVREAEIAAVHAFRGDFGTDRLDIIQTLNRMSSAFYILMLQEQSGRSIADLPV